MMRHMYLGIKIVFGIGLLFELQIATRKQGYILDGSIQIVTGNQLPLPKICSQGAAARCLFRTRNVELSIHNELACISSSGRVVYLIHTAQLMGYSFGVIVPHIGGTSSYQQVRGFAFSRGKYPCHIIIYLHITLL